MNEGWRLPMGAASRTTTAAPVLVPGLHRFACERGIPSFGCSAGSIGSSAGVEAGAPAH